MKNISQAKPQLLESATIHVNNGKVLIENPETSKQISLPIECKPILDLLNGQHTIKEIVSILIQDSKRLNFRTLFYALQTLDDAKLLSESLDLSTNEKKQANPAERSESFFKRPILEIILASHLNIGSLQHKVLFFVTSLSMICVFIAAATYGYIHFNARGFLQFNGSYLLAMPMFFLISSLLMCFKGLCKTLILLLSTGNAYYLKLRLQLFGISIEVSDFSTHDIQNKKITLLYFLSCATPYLLFAAIAHLLMPQHPQLHNLDLIAILLTFLDLDPYRKSELTLMLDQYFDNGDLRHLTSYLKNRAMFSVTRSSDIRGEMKLIIYSSVALIWTVSFCLFSMSLLTVNYPNLLRSIKSSPIIDTLCAISILTLLAILFGNLLYDFTSTMLRNLVFPLLTPYLRVLQKIKTKELTHINKSELKTSLKNISFFQEFSEQALNSFINASKVKKFKSGTRLIIQGETGKELFVLLEGSVHVLKREETGLETQICTLSENSVFGEIALLKDCVRTADVVASEDITALIIEKEALNKVLADSHSNDSDQKNDHQKILDRIALGHYLTSTPLFKDLPAESLSVFTRLGKLQHIAANTTIIEEGAKGDTFYLVIRGQLNVLKDGKQISQLKQGDFFGEISLLASIPRTATINSTEEALVLALDADAFWQVISENITLAISLETVAEDRRGDAA